MATYTLADAPEITVSVRGKDSPNKRDQAMDKILEMLELGELPTELLDGLSAEQLILIEAPTKTSLSQDDEEKDPLPDGCTRTAQHITPKKQSATTPRNCCSGPSKH